MAFAALTIDLNARLAKFEQDLSKVGRSMDGLNKKAIGLSSAFKSIVVPSLVAAGVVSMVKGIIQTGDELDKLAKRTNLTVKELSSLELIAEQSDTNLDTLSKGVNRLSVSLAEAADDNKDMAKAFKDLGVSAKDPIQALFQLADATKNTTDSNKTNADLMKVLSKSYQEMLPLLREGGDSLRKSAEGAEKYSEAMADLSPVSAAFNDNIATLRTELKTTIAEGTTPFIKSLNDVAAAYVNADNQSIGISTWGERLGNAFKGYIIVAEGFISVFKDVVNTATYGSAAITEVLAGNFRKAGYWIQQLGLKYKETGEAYKKFASDVATGAKVNAFVPTGVGGNSQTAQFECVASGGRWDGKKCVKRSSGGVGVKSDPLAGLLASTDIGRLKEFDKQVALLNSRFNYGKKDADLYAQAMTKLVESTFSSNFSDFNKQLAEQSETQRAVADHLQATNDSLFEQQQAWTDAGRALEDEMRTPLENANIEFGRLDELLERGAITWETYTRAVFKTQEAIATVPEKLKEMDTFAKTAAENIQNSFADFLFDPFDDGLKGMAQSFGNMIKKMIAEAVAADLARKLFGGLSDQGKTSGSGLIGGLFSTIGGLMNFDGGGYTGPGSRSGGVDGKGGFLSVLHPNETVVDHTKRNRNSGGGHTINVYVSGTNAPDVRRAAGQGAREALGMFGGAQRYA